MGLPLAQNMREVVPISEAMSVKKLSLPNKQKDNMIMLTEDIQIKNSVRVNDGIFILCPPKNKKHLQAHLQRPNDVLANAIHFCPAAELFNCNVFDYLRSLTLRQFFDQQKLIDVLKTAYFCTERNYFIGDIICHIRQES